MKITKLFMTTIFRVTVIFNYITTIFRSIKFNQISRIDKETFHGLGRLMLLYVSLTTGYTICFPGVRKFRKLKKVTISQV